LLRIDAASAVAANWVLTWCPTVGCPAGALSITYLVNLADDVALGDETERGLQKRGIVRRPMLWYT
jgi:hypothetical protein